VSSEIKFFAGRLDELVKLMSQLVEKLRAEAKDFQASELQALAHNSDRIDQQLKLVDDALGTIRGQDKISQEAIGAVKDLVKDAGESVKAGLKMWSETLAKSNESLCREVEGSVGAGFAAVCLCVHSGSQSSYYLSTGGEGTESYGSPHRVSRPRSTGIHGR
jgi:kinesin family member 11